MCVNYLWHYYLIKKVMLNSNFSLYLNNLKYIGGSCTLNYQSSNQLGTSIKFPKEFTNIFSVNVSINYTEITAIAVQKTDRVFSDLETLKNTGYLNIYACSDDNDYLTTETITVSWIVSFG